MNPHRLLALLATGAAILVVLLGTSKPTRSSLDVTALATDIEREADHVSAMQLAEWIHARKTGLRVIDVRRDSEFAAFHIPSAERIPLVQLAQLAPRENETLVLYSGGGAHAAQGWVLLRAQGHQRVYFLRGGLGEWMDDVMNPVVPERTGNPAVDTVTDRVGALSRYFGGVPRAGAVPVPSGGSATTTTVARIKRRGC